MRDAQYTVVNDALRKDVALRINQLLVSQSEVARSVGISAGALNKWLNGSVDKRRPDGKRRGRATLSAETIDAIVRKLGGNLRVNWRAAERHDWSASDVMERKRIVDTIRDESQRPTD